MRRGLWRRVRGGFQFHEWGQRNLTRARVEADREYEREKKRKQRLDGKPHVNGTAVPAGHVRDGPGTLGGIPAVSVSMSESVSGSGPNGPEPPRKCPDHERTRNPPNCGNCADQRKRHDEWLTDRNERARLAAKCRVHRGQLAHNCALCRAEELSPA